MNFEKSVKEQVNKDRKRFVEMAFKGGYNEKVGKKVFNKTLKAVTKEFERRISEGNSSNPEELIGILNYHSQK